MLRRMMLGLCFRLGAFVAAALVSTAVSAAPVDARTRLRHCGTDTCLLVTGRRADREAPVRIAGHDVAVRGRHAWRAELPLATVRLWSAPFARTIDVQVAGADGGATKARLPIGLLGHIDLAFLDVSARH